MIRSSAIQFTAAISREESPISLISSYAAQTIFEYLRNSEESLNIIYTKNIFEWCGIKTQLWFCQINSKDEVHHELIAEKPPAFINTTFIWLRDKLFAFDLPDMYSCYIARITTFTRISENNWREEDLSVDEICRKSLLPGGTSHFWRQIIFPEFKCGTRNNFRRFGRFMLGIVGEKIFCFVNGDDMLRLYNVKKQQIESIPLPYANRFELPPDEKPFINIGGMLFGLVSQSADGAFVARFDTQTGLWQNVCKVSGDQSNIQFSNMLNIEWRGKFCVVSRNSIRDAVELVMIDLTTGKPKIIKLSEDIIGPQYAFSSENF
ncbi:MAG: hypothetical protein M0R33_17320 [Methylomonas sp.]|jgi:hypothetical protein|uniref:hypothetical protein n=1 Tax=Methylomonas sp. TaxID=418 RepID=UPI0025EEF588|nr:hypothetical protein [Methylomonas sp.]MCK9608208.1 hypothetical protein [Methylomonas sp.]